MEAEDGLCLSVCEGDEFGSLHAVKKAAASAVEMLDHVVELWFRQHLTTQIFSTVLVNESSLLFPNVWHRRETVPSAMKDTKPYISQGGCPTFLTI